MVMVLFRCLSTVAALSARLPGVLILRPAVAAAALHWEGESKPPSLERRRAGGGGGCVRRRGWGCVDRCCWLIGYACTAWWLLLFLSAALPAAFLPAPEPPGARLKREGLRAFHPVVLVPGIVTGGLELWEGRPCAEGLFRKRLWGAGSFIEIFKRPLCWLEHMSLDNETGLDPPGIRVRAVPGLVAADYFTPGYFVWAVLIENLARIGYEGKNLHMATYDWRLSFHNTEVRDQSLSRLKSNIELMVRTSGGRRAVVVPHSMGALYFLHFLKWVEAPKSAGGGGGGAAWCARHIRAVMNIGPTFLGVPKAVSGIFSADAKDVASFRAMAPGMLDSRLLGLRTLQHIMRVSRTWDSMHSLLPKGGDAIWGGLDWWPEQSLGCSDARSESSGPSHRSDGKPSYGRIISFGKAASELPSSELHVLPDSCSDYSGGGGGGGGREQAVWTEYNEMSSDGILAVAEKRVYSAGSVHDLLGFVAPKLLRRANAHFSYGVADDLDDPKYARDHRYWSNPLETRLPDAPEMEMYCLYGVGIPTERSYIYKQTSDGIPFQIDSSARGGECSKGGVLFPDGDQSVPVLSAGFMCAKGWRGRTRFNPSGMAAYVREYRHKPPASLLHGRGTESGAHVDIVGNSALIEDVMRVAAGGVHGADSILSDILEISERVKIQIR